MLQRTNTNCDLICTSLVTARHFFASLLLWRSGAVSTKASSLANYKWNFARESRRETVRFPTLDFDEVKRN